MREKLWWNNEESKAMLERGYLLEGQTVQEKLNLITEYSTDLLNRKDLKDDILNVFERGWASLSSPIWANFGEGRGLPISCFSSYVPDNLEGIYDSLKEVALMTQQGGGTAGYFGHLRPKGAIIKGGGVSSGAVSFIEAFDTTIKNVSQSGVRRGGFAAYMDIDHPEVKDFLKIKDKGHHMQSIQTAVNVPDKWMEDMIAGDEDKREVWAEVIKSRREKGIPYIAFIDNINNNSPQVYKDKGLTIKQSNLCQEIHLSTDEKESLVCCLLSMNLATYDEWKDTNAVELMIYFLDSVMQDFINKTEGRAGFERANRFAKNQRALGLGVLGWHTYLQEKMIPFESIEAALLNDEIFADIFYNAKKASKKLAIEYGEPELLKGYGIRNATLMALAPTTSSSSILGQASPTIEPYKSNYYKVGLAKGAFMRKNSTLERLLESKGMNKPEVWESITFKKGSVQHLPLSRQEKAVFKTFEEIDQNVIIEQAAQRQKYIDQGQSLNLMIPRETSVKEVNALVIKAWKLGVKGLYYQRGTSASKEELLKLMEDCPSCSA